jgi:hypothetical protein
MCGYLILAERDTNDGLYFDSDNLAINLRDSNFGGLSVWMYCTNCDPRATNDKIVLVQMKLKMRTGYYFAVSYYTNTQITKYTANNDAYTLGNVAFSIANAWVLLIIANIENDFILSVNRNIDINANIIPSLTSISDITDVEFGSPTFQGYFKDLSIYPSTASDSGVKHNFLGFGTIIDLMQKPSFYSSLTEDFPSLLKIYVLGSEDKFLTVSQDFQFLPSLNLFCNEGAFFNQTDSTCYGTKVI